MFAGSLFSTRASWLDRILSLSLSSLETSAGSDTWSRGRWGDFTEPRSEKIQREVKYRVFTWIRHHVTGCFEIITALLVTLKCRVQHHHQQQTSKIWEPQELQHQQQIDCSRVASYNIIISNKLQKFWYHTTSSSATNLKNFGDPKNYIISNK